MFKATPKDPKLFRDAIDTIAQIIDDGLFKVKKEGIELLASDRAMVSVVDFKLKSSAFENYECDKERRIGVSLINFLTILKRISPEDKMTIELNENDNKLEILLEGKSVRRFSLPLIEVSAEDLPQIDKFEFSGTAEVKSDIFEQGINDADIVADSVLIELAENMFRMFAEGNGSKAELKLEKGDSLLYLLTKSKVKSKYSLEYLKKMIKGSKLSPNTKIYMGNPQQKDYPLKLEFKGDNVSLVYILAPRVSESD